MSNPVIHAVDDPGNVDIMEPFKNKEPIVYFNNFDVETQYDPFSKRTHELITIATEKISNDCSILPKQTGPCALPPLWHLQGLSCSDDDESALAFRLDNLDIVGFVNKTGHWHSFEELEHLLPGSRGLSYRNDFDSLIGGHMELTKVWVDRSSILDALRTLSNYDPNTSVEEEIKLSLARLRVITSEAQRFTRISQAVNDGWMSKESFIRAEDARYVLMWREISAALLSWKETGSWGGQHVRSLSTVDIHNEKDALSVVRLVCDPPTEI